MKRKLDEADVPTEVAGDNPEGGQSFHDLGLDNRLLQAIALQKFSSPTAVQLKAIPQALAGKDVIVRSQTGSGKTAAYALPILQRILQRKTSNPAKATSTLILVPTRELAQQISKVLTSFSGFCGKEVRIVNITQKISDDVQRTLLADLPDIVVATPASAAHSISSATLSVSTLFDLVIDEADLVLSYGYEDDLQTLSSALPKGVRTSLVSATLAADITKLTELFCRNPVIVDLKEDTESGGEIVQYAVSCAEQDKFLLAYVMFKLKLVKGKCIIFVADIDRCYRLKLFLEQFGIRSCVLNSELPVNSRIHVVEEFNKGVYDIIVASDEHELVGGIEAPRSTGVEEQGTAEMDVDDNNKADDVEVAAAKPEADLDHNSDNPDDSEEDAAPPTSRKRSKKRNKNSREYGVSRGIDFQAVACVLNFDFPQSSKSYTHRIGRTARAGQSGMALSFVIPLDQYKKHPPTSIPSTKTDEKVLASVKRYQIRKGRSLEPYHFDMKAVEPFRYRMTDALRAVTRLAIREARTRELRQELLKSEKLKRHFEDNPDELRHLRHDGELRAARTQAHLRHVPDYLMPKTAAGATTVTNTAAGTGATTTTAATGEAIETTSPGASRQKNGVGFVPLNKPIPDNRIRKAKAHQRMRAAAKGKTGGGKGNPLKTFRAGGPKKR